jgi:glyoxylase-like metal-dependent hydrolase (beta-lactamase superfamily II)
MEIIEVGPRLHRILLPQDVKGFQRFIGSWVYDGDVTFLVDVGPRASFEKLMEGLEALNIRRLDFVFLTHIHIDHAGATGLLTARYPMVKVICHESGIKHLIDPRKLWEGSKKVLGELAVKYGEIEPVPEKYLLAADRFNQDGFRLVNTPGHAAHHISLFFGDHLFVGEAGGIFIDLDHEIYLRPATPPRFILEEAVGSIDRLLEDGDRDICYGHSGIHPDAKKMLRLYKNQLYQWRDVIAEQMKDSREESLMERCISALTERDEFLRLMTRFNDDDKEREFYYIRNSIQGFIEYLK